MASPSSSATTQSPPLAYLEAGPATSATSEGSTGDGTDIQDRDNAITKFIARAEVSKLTFNLRARLAYATYKASHRVPHLPMHDLEVKSQAVSLSRAVPAKRKGTTSNMQNPAIQTHRTIAQPTSRHGQMAPPPSVSRTASSGHDGPANAGQSLFSAILGPPASKNARTIRNPSAPPAPAVSRIQNARKVAPQASPRTRTRSHPDIKRSRHHRGRSSERRPHKGKEKERVTPDSAVSVATNNDDPETMAARTLSSFFSWPTISGSTASPRSSFSAASDQSLPQYAQSSARTTTDGPSSGMSSAERPLTPPASQSSTTAADTPKRSAPTDKEAAEYMLILATSPSPVRARTQSTRDAMDRATRGELGGGARELLFRGPQSDGERSPSEVGRRGKPLTKEGSFSSTIPVVSPADTQSTDGGAQVESSIAGARTGNTLTPASLLPPPPAPHPRVPSSSSSSIFPSDPKQLMQAPPTPGNFNMREFVNMSPSPRTPMKVPQSKPLSTSPSERLAKKLFESESRDSGGHSAPLGGALAAGFGFTQS